MRIESAKIKKINILMAFAFCFIMGFSSAVYGAQTGIEDSLNMSVLYGITASLSLVLLIGFGVFVKKKPLWLLLLYVSVFIVNAGYFSLSSAKTLEEALLANRISYLGSVFLPMFMMMSIAEVCRLEVKKWFTALLICINVAVFIIAASPGYTCWYYKDVELIFVDGAAKLVKVYGPLHKIYFIYLFSYFAMMTGIIFYSTRKKERRNEKKALMLLLVVFINIVFWLVEQLIRWNFEFLSITYIFSEILLLILYSEIGSVSSEENDFCREFENSAERYERLCAAANLSAREKDVFDAIMKGKKRKDIADELFISENTVKTHTSNIFSKFEVSSRSELFEKVNNEK